MRRPLIVIFPGQSSRDAAMLERLAAVAPAKARDVQQILTAMQGQPFTGIFNSNHGIQLAVFACTLAYLELLQAEDLRCDASAGLSLGEYAHLVAITALDAESAYSLVSARGRCYDEGPDGCMAALSPLDLSAVQSLCAQVCNELDQEHAVAIANINSPTQTVVAGSHGAVQRLLDLALEEFFVNGQIIESRIPMHVRRFQPVATPFRQALEAAPWRYPRADYWPNITARQQRNPGAPDFIDALSRHVYQPVLWRDTIDAMQEQFNEAIFVEVGPLQVLRRMLIRKWIAPERVFAVDLMERASATNFAEQMREIRRALTY